MKSPSVQQSAVSSPSQRRTSTLGPKRELSRKKSNVVAASAGPVTIKYNILGKFPPAQPDACLSLRICAEGSRGPPFGSDSGSNFDSVMHYFNGSRVKYPDTLTRP